MPAPSIAPLVEGIRASMPKVPKRIRQRVSNIEWFAPPIYIRGVSVGGVDLAPYCDIAAGNVSAIRGAWEEYLHFFVQQLEPVETAKKDWLAKRLGLQGMTLAWAFPRASLETHEGTLASILALAANKAGADIDFEGGGAVLALDGFEIGIRADGEIISRFCKGVHLQPFDYWAAIAGDYGEGHRRRYVSADLATFYRAAGLIEDEARRGAVRLALRVLFFRYANLGRLTNYLYAGSGRNGARAKALRELSNRMLDSNNPVPLMYGTLVDGGLVTVEEFTELFPGWKQYKNKPETHYADVSEVSDWFNTITRMRKSHK